MDRKQAAGQRLFAALRFVEEVARCRHVHDIEIRSAKAAHGRPVNRQAYQAIEPTFEVEPSDRSIANERCPIISFVVEIGSVDPPGQVAGIEEDALVRDRAAGRIVIVAKDGLAGRVAIDQHRLLRRKRQRVRNDDAAVHLVAAQIGIEPV